VLLLTPRHPCRARDPGEKWWRETVWRISVVKSRSGHPAAMPPELAKRCIAASDYPRLVLDPFARSGTTLLAAARLGTNAIGFELESDYIQIARQRLMRDAGGGVLRRPDMRQAEMPQGVLHASVRAHLGYAGSLRHTVAVQAHRGGGLRGAHGVHHRPGPPCP
jgi:hypothetical protein